MKNESKHVLKSRTILGALAVILPPVLAFLGVNLTDDQTALFTENTDNFIAILGGIIAIYGRIVAKDKLKL